MKNITYFLAVVLMILGCKEDSVSPSRIIPQAQWQKTYSFSEYDIGQDVCLASDGGYVITGRTDSNFYIDRYLSAVLLFKISESGDLEWHKDYAGMYSAQGYDVESTNDGGYIIVGDRDNDNSPSNEDIWLIKTDSQGNKEWDKIFGGDEHERGYSISVTQDDGFIIGGVTKSYGEGMSDFWILKTDAFGNCQWSKTFGGIDVDKCTCIEVAPEGGYLASGITGSFGVGGYDGWLLKLDESGNEEWRRTFGGEEDDWIEDICITSNNECLLAGYTESYELENYSGWLLKVEGAENLSWSHCYGSENRDYIFSISQTSDDNFVLAGCSDSFGYGRMDGWVILVNQSGDELWSTAFGGPSSERFYSIIESLDYGYIAVGYSEISDFKREVWVVKI